MNISEINDSLDCAFFVTTSICAHLSNEAAKTLADNANVPDEISARINGLLDDLIGELGEDGEDFATFETRLLE